MKSQVPMNAVLLFCLCALLLTPGQDQEAYRAKSEKAARIATNVERTIRANEPKWRLKDSHPAGPTFTQSWKSGRKELELRIYVYDSPEEASKMLPRHGAFEISGSEKLDDFGEEARFISIRYFTWVGVRKGRLLAEVQGPGQEFTTTKRFAQHALEQLEDH